MYLPPKYFGHIIWGDMTYQKRVWCCEKTEDKRKEGGRGRNSTQEPMNLSTGLWEGVLDKREC